MGVNLQTAGYRTHFVFLSLPSGELAVARVADRVRRGGHDVPDAVVRRRFAAGLRSLFSVYMDVVDAWTIMTTPTLRVRTLSPLAQLARLRSSADAEAWKFLKELPT